MNITLDEYQDAASKTAIYPAQGTALGLNYVALKLSGEAGEVAENVGKAMRDDNLFKENRVGDAIVFVPMELTKERRLKLKKECGDTLWYISQVAKELGYKLSEIADENLVKLSDRDVRGVLRGSGDDR